MEFSFHCIHGTAAVCGWGNAGLQMKREGEKVAKFSSHCHCCSTGGMHVGERFTLCKICAQVVPEQISFQILRISQSKSICFHFQFFNLNQAISFRSCQLFPKKCARTWTIYRFRRHLSPISSPFCTSGPSRLQPIAVLPPLWPQNWNKSEHRLWTVRRRTALKIWIEEPGRASCRSFSPQRSVCARVKGH